MTAAINGNPKENDKARTYGAIFINYHPYYYRGIAYLNTGKYEQAISDFEKASGPGEENLGSIETLMSRAKGKLAQANTPPPPEPQPPAPQPRVVPAPVPVPVQPAAPSIDPALRQRANAEINQAKTRLAAAMQRKAGNTPQYAQATQALTDALTKSGSARSNDDLNAAIASAQNAATIADLAPAPGAPAPPPTAIPTRPTQASAVVLADSDRRVRDALESYFSGEFEDATKKFRTLADDMPRTATSGPSSAPPNTPNTPSKPTTATKTKRCSPSAKPSRSANGTADYRPSTFRAASARSSTARVSSPRRWPARVHVLALPLT